MPVLHDTEVDGVRCFWVATGRPTLAAVLLFRFGLADEPLVETGWQHVLEHLALEGRGGGALNINGSVSMLDTAFEAHGPADAVADHLLSLTSWLAEPDLSALDHERGVLRAEADLRGSGPSGRAMGWRYGARGPGVASFGEPGIGRATADQLQQRARAVFTMGNAVLLLDGPPSANLRLRLPAGDVVQPRPAVPCEDQLPAGYVEGAGVVASGVVERSNAMGLGADLLQQGLLDKLRHRAGAAYAPWSAYERVDADHAVLLAGFDVRVHACPDAATAVRDVIGRLATDGPDEAALAAVRDRRLQALRDPYNSFGLAALAGQRHLAGRSPQSLDEVLEEVGAVTCEEVRLGFESMRGSLLLGAPEPALARTELRWLEFPSRPGRAEGQRFRGLNWPAVDEELVIGDRSVELRADGVARGVDADEVEGLFVFADGGRHLLRSDGYGITVEPTGWQRGWEAVDALDRFVPVDRHLPHEARPERPAFEQLPAVRRWWYGALRKLPKHLEPWIAGLFIVACLIAGVAAGTPFLFGLAIAFTFQLIRELRRTRKSGASSPGASGS